MPAARRSADASAAWGGVVDELRIPVRFIGIGEAVQDLRPFDPDAFCDALFASDADTGAARVS